jgi:CheY-like chemotaxis protein
MFKAGRGVLQDCRVLVVEDEYLIAADLAAVLGRAGATVVGPISTVAGGERMASGYAPLHGAVVDVSLHGEMAWPVADRLAARGVPFVFATGYNRACIPERFSNVPCFMKPIMMGQVIMTLVNQMRRANSTWCSPPLSIGSRTATPDYGLRASKTGR